MQLEGRCKFSMILIKTRGILKVRIGYGLFGLVRTLLTYKNFNPNLPLSPSCQINAIIPEIISLLALMIFPERKDVKCIDFEVSAHFSVHPWTLGNV